MDLIIQLKLSVLELFWKTQLVFTVHNNIIIAQDQHL